MGDDENHSKQNQKEQDALKENLKTGAKTAANAYAGPIGGKAVDILSKTRLGDNILNQAGNTLKNNPVMGQALNHFNKSEPLNTTDKNDDLEKKNEIISENIQEKDNSVQDSNKELSPNLGKEKDSGLNPFSSNKKEKEKQEDETTSSKIFELIKKHKSIAAGIGCSCVLALIFLILIIVIILGPFETIKNFFSGIFEFFTTDNQEQEKSYYDSLKKAQSDINKTSSGKVCIDVNLITAALTVNSTLDDILENGQTIIDDVEIDENGNENAISYSEMERQIKVLANMQITNKKYSLDKTHKEETGSYCSTTAQEVPINADNQNRFERGWFWWLSESSSIDSSTPQLIAGNDMQSIKAFFTLKASEEKNYAYYLYYPPFAEDGTCSDDYAKSMLPENEMSLSIGDNASRENSVFYWNLIDSFIGDYYNDYLSKNEPERSEQIKQIADDIYLLYSTIGPSQTCSIAYQGPSSLCSQGITVESENGNFIVPFEDYVAGVVSGEAYSTAGMEALKAQAVAARTYALNATNYCQNSIKNSSAAQNFSQNINDRARQATQETAGEILLDENGKVFASMYDSFCYDDEDCPDAIRNSDGTYSVTYTKMPNGEKHTIILSDPNQYGRITHGKGHAKGMSQLVSYQMADEGKTYQEILAYFYSDSVTLSLVLSPTTTEGATIITGPVTNYIDVAMFNQNIFSRVKQAGIGTREGVVAAATSLVSEFYSQTGYKLPYELYPSGKYTGYGVDSAWGTFTNRTDYPLNGLDCSGFVSWAIHNGGYQYETKSAQGWGSTGVARSWSYGTVDQTAQPGDLIYNKPSSSNGTTGHIRMIIGVTDTGYIVAEASSGKNGIRITEITFKSTGPYTLVDMSEYYLNHPRVTDYPE